MKPFSRFILMTSMLCGLSAQAQVPIDLSSSQLNLKDSQTIRVNNLSVPGFGTFQLDFKWNPNTLSFVADISSLVPNGTYCEAASLTGNQQFSQFNIKGYHYRTRTSSVGTFGAVVANASSSNTTPFTMSWAKTAVAADNPYLVGKTVTSFDPTHGYGVIGNTNGVPYPGLSSGMFVEVTGSLAEGAITVKALSGSTATVLLVAPGTTTTQTNCPATGSGTYTGNYQNSSFNLNGYTITIQDVRSGSMVANGTNTTGFTVTWDASVAAKPGTNMGLISAGSPVFYPFLATGNSVFITDVGGALTFTNYNAAQTGTAVFWK